MRTQALLLPFLAVSILILSSCAAVDLVPLRSEGSARPGIMNRLPTASFGGAGLIVTIKNQGNDNAPSSVTSVIFHIRGGGDVVRLLTRLLAALVPPIVAMFPCQSDALLLIVLSTSWLIIVIVFESNENNNNVMGLCTG